MIENNPVKRKELSVKEFEDLLTGKLLNNKKYKHFYTHDPIHTYSIDIKDCIISRNEIFIENVSFPYAITFGENTVFEYEVAFRNCLFTRLAFQGVTFKRRVILQGIFDNIFVDNIYCEKYFTWQSSTFKSQFVLQNGKFDDSLNFQECKTGQGCNFKIENGIFNGSVNINGIYEGRFSLSGGEFNENFRIGQKNKITEFKKDFIINGGNFNDFLIIEKSAFNKDFLIINKNVNIKKFEVISGNFGGNAILAHASIDTAIFFGGEFLKNLITQFAQIRELFITGGNYNLINIKEGELKRFVVRHKEEIDNLNLSTDYLNIKEIKFRQSSIINAYISGKSDYTNATSLNKISFSSASLYKDSVIQINEFRLKEITFEYFTNLGYISFNNILFYSEGINKDNFKLKLINSDLGKTLFIDCQSHFRNFATLEFAHSKMLDIFVSDTTLPKQIVFPKDKNNHANSVLDKRNRNDSQRELAFNQLKKVYENRGDISNSLDYHAKALNARRKILFEELFGGLGDDLYLTHVNKIFNPMINIFRFVISFFYKPMFASNQRRDYFEWLNLSINQFSNNHGSSWHRGLATTILITGLCYSIYCCFAGFQIGDWGNEIHWNTFKLLLSYSGDFLNPIQKDDIFKKFYPENDNIDFPMARLWGFFSRIVIAYFVYQTIQAFRKFGKKGS